VTQAPTKKQVEKIATCHYLAMSKHLPEDTDPMSSVDIDINARTGEIQATYTDTHGTEIQHTFHSDTLHRKAEALHRELMGKEHTEPQPENNGGESRGADTTDTTDTGLGLDADTILNR